MTLDHADLFHLSCWRRRVRRWLGLEDIPDQYRYVYVPDADERDVLSQVSLRCCGCGSRLTIDVWPMQRIDGANWSIR